MSGGNDLLGRREIAAILKVQVNTVDQWRQRGLFPLPRRRIGGSPVWTRADVVRWAVASGRL